MKPELKTLKQEAAALKAQVGTETKTVVFRCLDNKGNQTAYLDLCGNGVEPEAGAIVLDVPEKAIKPLLRGKRHTLLHGGRAGGKSHTIARYLVALAYAFPLRILCLREVQLSIRDSVHSLMRDIIESVPEFRECFEILESEIRGINGSLFTFRGLRKESAHSIKSFEGFDLAWTEEAQALSRRSLDLLTPTIRKSGSRLIWSMNAELAEQPVFVDFLSEDAIHDENDSAIEQVLYTDNCFVSAETLADAELDKRTDYAKYRHVWLGGLREKGRGQIFPDFTVIPAFDVELPVHTRREFERYGMYLTTRFEREHGVGSIFCGLDAGHGASPTHLVFGWYSKEKQKILIIDEYCGVEKSPNEIATELDEKLPMLKQKHIALWCDPAGKGLVMHLRDCGFNAKSAIKWPDSVIQGIDFLRSHEIVISENCPVTIKDFSLYSWELDANDTPTGIPEKKHDHSADAVRYALWNQIKNRGHGYAKMPDPYLS